MTTNQRVAFFIITILASLALANGLKFAVIYYNLSEVINPQSIRIIEVNKAELATLTRDELENMSLSLLEATKVNTEAALNIPTTLFYTLLSLVLSLKVSVFFNYQLSKNTHNKKINKDT